MRRLCGGFGEGSSVACSQPAQPDRMRAHVSGRVERPYANRGEAYCAEHVLWFITKYAVPGGQRQSTRYPKHVKGHITVFPNNVQELVTNVLPHPLLKAMDDVHVSWQGAEKSKPSDLSALFVSAASRCRKGTGVAEEAQSSVCEHRNRCRGNGELGRAGAWRASPGLSAFGMN